jgi:hypothetical protein
MYYSYQILWEVVCLEQCPLGFVSTIEELPERKSSGFGPENLEYRNWDPSRWPRGTFYPQKLALTSRTSGDCLLGIVLSRTQATEFNFSLYFLFRITLTFTTSTNHLSELGDEIKGVSKIALQWYCKCYSQASVTKTFTLKGLQTIHTFSLPPEISSGIHFCFPAALGPGVYSACNRNE